MNDRIPRRTLTSHQRSYSALLPFACLLLSALPSVAAAQVFDEIFLIRGIERVDGVPDTSEPHFFGACITGPDIATSPTPTVQTPPSTNFPTGTTQTLTADGDELCLNERYASLAALLADYPAGTYTFTATDAGSLATDSIAVALSSADPTAYADITEPVSDGLVPANASTPIEWSLVDLGGCNTSMPETCVDFFVVFAFVDEQGLPDDELFFERIEDPTAAETTVPAGTFQADIGYQIEVETRRGSVAAATTDTLGLPVTVFKGGADINATSVTGAATAVPSLALPALGVLSIGFLAIGTRHLRRSA